MRMRGSATVEAAMLMPFLLGLMLWVGFMGMWLHNRVVVYCNAAEYTLVGDGGVRDSALLGETETSLQPNQGTVGLKATEKGYTQVPFDGWFRMLGWATYGELDEYEEKTLYDPPQLLRIYRGVKGE